MGDVAAILGLSTVVFLPGCVRVIVERSYLTTIDRISLDAVRRVRDGTAKLSV